MAEKDKDVLNFDDLENIDFLDDIKSDDNTLNLPKKEDETNPLDLVGELPDDLDSNEESSASDFSFDDKSLDAALQNFKQSNDQPAQSIAAMLGQPGAKNLEPQPAPPASAPQPAPAPKPAPKSAAVDFVPDGPQDSYADPQQQQLHNLQWYSGEVEKDAFELSIDNLPDVIDVDLKVKILHINVDSGYGWNIFFGNGVFMNLRDLVEYQERHGSIPYHSGKVIYGSKTTAFDKIEKIIVYEKPRYFEYKAQK